MTRPRCAEPGPNGIVFPAPEGGYLRRDNFRRRFWLPALDRAGIEHLRFHDLRHAAATIAVRAGVDTKTLMAHLGHSSVDAALRYQHARGDRVVADAMDAVIAESTQDSTGRSGTRVARQHLRVVE